MQYRLLALDIDGTLLNSKGEITPRVREAIKRAVDVGCTVLLATGRMYRAMVQINESLGLSAPCMVYGGAQIVKDGKVLYESPLPSALAHEFLDWAADVRLHAQVYVYDDFLYEKENQYSREYADFCKFPGVEFPHLRSMHTIWTPKILGIGEPDDIDRFEIMAKERFSDRLNISRSKPRFLEINNPATSKGVALDYLAKSLGLTAENCIAMGDATLDLPMIEYAGLGVAMENADAVTKKSADFICPSNDADGVACVIEQFILNGA
ncbi:Cof-type HAD-IIB family hydrolase [Eubacteriales bacterium OttesenSCG-928-M02]|nr:Cof-type HAD-IIB family hydrolase [Eubacteriales bacterium OttesenSCG-928-M02]